MDVKVDATDISKISESAKKMRASDTFYKKQNNTFLREIEKDKNRLLANAEYQKRAQAITEKREWAKNNYYVIAKTCEKRVLEVLISPKTAEFSSPSVEDIHFNDDKIRYNGYVDSQNAY